MLTFSIPIKQHGKVQVCDLIPNGSNIPVTDSNKKDFIEKRFQYFHHFLTLNPLLDSSS
jgi:hypothetical protein